MGFEMRGIDHQSVGLTCLARQGLENPVEHAQFAPSKKPIIERLVRTVFLRRVLPLKSMFQHVNYTADHTSVIDTGDAVRQWEIRPDPTKLGRRQQKQITHGSSSCHE
jgi:hypothetical protein